jgi:hypothetical protein
MVLLICDTSDKENWAVTALIRLVEADERCEKLIAEARSDTPTGRK